MTVAVTERGAAMDESPTPFEEALNKTGNGLYNYLLASTSALILLAIGVDLFGFSLVVAAACELKLSLSQKGILTSIPFIGILLVSYAWGYISDIKGRRFTLVLSMGTAFVLSCLSCLSPNWICLAVLKFLSVCFSCASHSATYTLVGESCIQRVRSKYMVMMTCLLLLSSGVGGVLAYPTLKLNFSIALPILNIMFRPWRLLIIVMAIPSGIGGLAIYFFHESPKFLANSGRTDEAVHVLKRIFEINHRGSKEEFCIKSVLLEEESTKKEMSFMRSIYEQSATLFRPPFLWRTLQLYYLIAVVYITNNTFLIWLPHILDMVRQNLESSSATKGNICSLISTDPVTAASLKVFNNTDIFNSTITVERPAECSSGVEDNVVFTLVISQCIFTVLNFVISYLPNYRKMVLITILCLSSLSGVCLNLMPEPIPSVFFFVTFGCTCLGMGILASYFVDMYPTSYRGMVACLSIMVGRSSAFVGINIVGNLLFNYCQITFYAWSLLVFSAVVVAYFLPPDKVVKSG